jgi:DNA mismatch repair protein PMS2
VILDLAGAVKELVENALDAGASIVEVRLRESGAELIEVADNGSGVSPAHYEALTAKYHTSKLSSFADLTSLSTFGFRGEALSSLCSLCELSVITRTAGEARQRCWGAAAPL